jgi:hypothetical protein
VLSYYADRELKQKIGDLSNPPDINPGMLLIDHEKRVRFYVRNESQTKYLHVSSALTGKEVFWLESYESVLAPGESAPVSLIYNPSKGDEDNESIKPGKTVLFHITEWDKHPLKKRAGIQPAISQEELEAARS